MVGTDHAIFGGHRAAFNQGQQVSLDPFPGHVGAPGFSPFADFVDFIHKHDSGLLDRIDCRGFQLLFVDQSKGFFLAKLAPCVPDRQPALALLLRTHLGEHALQLTGHFLHSRGRHDFNAGGAIGDFDFDLLVVEVTFAQFLAEDLPGRGRPGGIRVVAVVPGCRQECVQNPFFRCQFRLGPHLAQLGVAQQVDGNIDQVPDDRLHIPSNVADFGELGGFDLNKGGACEFGESAGNFGLSDPGRADHEDVFGCDLATQRVVQLQAPPAVSQGDGHCALGRGLADDVFVEFVNDFAGRQIWHEKIGFSRSAGWFRR